MHEHEHEHTHSSHSPEEAIALLSYMTAQNRHHAEELHDLAHSAGDSAAELIHEAVRLFNEGNKKLVQALSAMKGE